MARVRERSGEFLLLSSNSARMKMSGNGTQKCEIQTKPLSLSYDLSRPPFELPRPPAWNRFSQQALPSLACRTRVRFLDSKSRVGKWTLLTLCVPDADALFFLRLGKRHSISRGCEHCFCLLYELRAIEIAKVSFARRVIAFIATEPQRMSLKKSPSRLAPSMSELS